MILVENKINIFNKIVYLDRKKKSMEELEKFRENNRQILEKKKMELQKEAEEVISRKIKLAEKQKHDKLISLKEEERVLKLQRKEEIKTEILKDLEDIVKNFAKTDDYIKFEEKNFNELLPTLKDKEYYIRLKNTDMKLYDSLKEIAASKGITLNYLEFEHNYIGGFIILNSDKSYEIDCTLMGRIRNKEYEIGRFIHFYYKSQETGDKKL